MVKKFRLALLLAAALVAALLSFGLTACSSDGQEEIYTDRSWGMNSTQNFTETMERTVSFSANTAVAVDAVTNMGSLDIYVTDVLGNAIFRGTAFEGRNITFAVQETGEHTITVTGHSHYGSFNISW